MLRMRACTAISGNANPRYKGRAVIFRKVSELIESNMKRRQ